MKKNEEEHKRTTRKDKKNYMFEQRE